MSATLYALAQPAISKARIRTGPQATRAIWAHCSAARLAMLHNKFDPAGYELVQLSLLDFTGLDEQLRARIESFRHLQCIALFKQWEAMAEKLGIRMRSIAQFED